MKSKFNNYLMFLFMDLILTLIFNNKIISFAPNLNINLGLIIYSFSFLITGIMIKNNKLKDCKNTIYRSAILIFIFYIFITIFSTVNGIDDALEITNSIRNIFTPNYILINNFKLYYPDLLNLFSLLLIYSLTHYIFLIVYSIVEDNSNYLIGFIMAILISFILDQMLFLSITNIIDVINNNLLVNNFIRLLTANFIVLLFMSIIMVFLFPLFKSKKKK